MSENTPLYSVTKFAKLMDLNEEFVRQMCRRQLDKRTGKRYRLPKGWTATKLGRDWQIWQRGTKPSLLALTQVAETCSKHTDKHPASTVELTLAYCQSNGWTADVKQPKDGILMRRVRTALPKTKKR